MILTAANYLPMFMAPATLTTIFQAAAKDAETEVQALERVRVAAGQKAALPADLIAENVWVAENFAGAITLNLMDRLTPPGKAQESADVVQALKDEAAGQTASYEARIETGNNLTDEQVYNNASMRRDQALYKALCLRLAEAMPK